MMTLEQIAMASLIIQGFLVPCGFALVSLLWKMDRRILKIEMHLKLDSKEST